MFIKLGAELSNPERELISKNLHKLHRLYLNILHPPILCLCFLCSVIWSRRSASCEDSCCTSFCVWSSCTKTVLASKGPTFTRDYHLAATAHLPLERLPLVLLPVYVLDCQGDGAQPREPVQTLVLHTNYFSFLIIYKHTFNLQCLLFNHVFVQHL